MEALSKSPLKEAVCEIVFMPAVSFDLTLPGILYSALKVDFPIKKERPLIQVPLRINNGTGMEILQSPLTQFISADETKFVQIGRDILVTNVVNKYDGWDNFLEQITKVLALYKENQQNFTGIRQISLKYLNKIDTELDTPFSNIFSFPVPNPPKPKYKLNKGLHTVVEYSMGNDVLAKILRTVISPNPKLTSYLLEIQYINNNANSLDIDSIRDWLEQAHNEIYELFSVSFKQDYFISIK